MTSPPPAINSDALDLCAREPIHIPGAIQPHGALLVLDKPLLTVLQVSRNWNEFTGSGSPDHPVGRPLSEVIGIEAALRVREALEGDGSRADHLLTVDLNGRSFDVVPHRHDGVAIAELETAPASRALPLNRVLQRAMRDLRTAPAIQNLYHAIAESVSRLTGYGRVMVYRFDEEWNGQVVGECLSAPGVDSYMGHHFPASDIPEQARALYTKSWLRIIPEVTYTPAPLVPPVNPETGRPLDLSFSTLRSVSPVHLEYLRNMGVGASMSVSLIIAGKLWGLVACHHPEPRRLPFHTRTSCEIFGQVASLEISYREDSRRLSESAEATRIQTRFFDVIANEPNIESALTKYTPDLLTFMKADGAAIHINGRTTLLGTTPGGDHLPDLLDWLRSREMTPVYSTHALSAAFPPAGEYVKEGSGLLAVRLSPVEFHYLLFFRPEVVTKVTWAGRPDKAPDATGTLHPRQSFAAWVETVRGHSLPWSDTERRGGVELRNALNALVLKRTERLISSNEELEKRNTDLQSFAFIASHDLKEPIRGISQFSRYIEEDHGASLNAEALRMLRTIQTLSEHSARLLEALNRFSNLGRMDISRRWVEVDQLLDSVLVTLGSLLQTRKVEIRRKRPLPACLCDSVLAREVFSNLIVNAVKYNASPEPWIEIDWRNHDTPEEPPVFTVADNGIGIPERHWEAVFVMFRRLHPQEDFGGGTGAGLAIARSITERHGGWISVRSEPDVGSVFSFTFG